jgi:hypothetical protein
MENKRWYIVLGSIAGLLICCIGIMGVYLLLRPTPSAPVSTPEPVHRMPATWTPVSKTIIPNEQSFPTKDTNSETNYRSQAYLYMKQVSNANSELGQLFTDSANDISLINSLVWRNEVYDCLDRNVSASRELANLSYPLGFEHINSLFVETYQNSIAIKQLIHSGLEFNNPNDLDQAKNLIIRNGDIYNEMADELDSMQ